MTDPIEDRRQDDENATFEGQTSQEGEAESQEAGEEDSDSTEDEDKTREQTTSELGDKEEDHSGRFRPSAAFQANRSFDPDDSILQTDFGGGGEMTNRQRVLSTSGRGGFEIPSTSGGYESSKNFTASPVDPQRSFSRQPVAGQKRQNRGDQAGSVTRAAKDAPGRNADLAGFSSQFIQEDLEKTVEAIKAQQRQFSIVDQVNRSISQLMSQAVQQVGEANQSMLNEKMRAINDRFNKLGEKYERIKQLEEQMRESDRILDLLMAKR